MGQGRGLFYQCVCRRLLGLSECRDGLTANNLDVELVGAKRLLEASGLDHFRVSG